MNELTPKIRPIVPQSLKGNVLSQINKRKKLMKDIRNYSAIAAVIVAFIFVPIALGNITHAKAMDLIEDSIHQTNEIKTMIVTYSMRNPFTYNPDVIEMNSRLNEMTAKIIFEQQAIWRFSSKNKWYIFDGKCTYWHSNAYNYCLVGFINNECDFDKGDLGLFNAMFLKPTSLMETVQKIAENKNTKIDMQTKGDSITLVFGSKVRSIDKNRFMTGDLFGWYHNNLKYSFTTNCRQVYVFDKETKLLKNFYISVFYNNKYITILKSKKIEYNVPLNKSELLYISKDLPKRLLNSHNYLVNITSKEAVEKILTKLKNDSTAINWVPDRKEFFQKMVGMEILVIGEPIKEENYAGEIFPCKLKLRDGEVINTNIAVRNDNEFKIWILDKEN
jgi:hypothetical protein